MTTYSKNTERYPNSFFIESEFPQLLLIHSGIVITDQSLSFDLVHDNLSFQMDSYITLMSPTFKVDWQDIHSIQVTYEDSEDVNPGKMHFIFDIRHINKDRRDHILKVSLKYHPFLVNDVKRNPFKERYTSVNQEKVRYIADRSKL